MLKVYAINGITPVVHPTAFVHPSAVLIGDVFVGPRCYVGPNAVMRGDFGRLVLEEGANLQDTCVMHGFPGKDTVVDVDGHIGHGAVLHGCHIGRNAMVGMNAVVMDDVVVGDDCIVAAAAFIKANMEIPPRMLVMGAPARIVRELRPEEIAWKRRGTQEYQDLAVRSLSTMVLTEALPEGDRERPRLAFQAEGMHKLKAEI